MLSFAQIQQFYPPQLHSFGSFLLREYLQHKILALLFNSDYALKFAFLGGTCLRIVHQTNRFSEDLDFDNFNLLPEDFEQVAVIIQEGLEREGLLIEMEQVYKGAFLNRRQPKGRDIYDITFLCSKTRPNYAYLSQNTEGGRFRKSDL